MPDILIQSNFVHSNDTKPMIRSDTVVNYFNCIQIYISLFKLLAKHEVRCTLTRKKGVEMINRQKHGCQLCDLFTVYIPNYTIWLRGITSENILNQKYHLKHPVCDIEANKKMVS